MRPCWRRVCQQIWRTGGIEPRPQKTVVLQIRSGRPAVSQLQSATLLASEFGVVLSPHGSCAGQHRLDAGSLPAVYLFLNTTT